MTYCLGIKVSDGLIGLADGRITTGHQLTSARKVTLHGPRGNRFLVMTSGLRSLRDKTLAYLERQMRARAGGFPVILDAIDCYGACLRRVVEEDRQALEASKLTFNLHAIIGGQFPDDPEPCMFLVYPEGNWIEVDRRTPYLSIGETTYGKPILDRTLSFNSSMATALKFAYLSFDSTRFSSTDVGFPIDIVTYAAADRRWRESLYDYDDLRTQRDWWNQNITELAKTMPDGPWVDSLLPMGPSAHLAVVPDDP